ncbi:MAG: hypothetical protein ABIO92_03665 [Chloroflexia bacterium]
MNDTTRSNSIEASSTPPDLMSHADERVEAFVPIASTSCSGMSEVFAPSSEKALTSANVKPVRRRGPAPFFTLLGFVLRDYFRCPWPLVNVAILVIVHSLFFNYRSNQSHFFAIEYAMVVVIAALTTASIFARGMRPETYAILARPVRRIALTGAMLLASWLISLFFHLISTLIESIRFSQLLNPGLEEMLWRNPVTHLIGMLPIMVSVATTVGLIALLSTFVSSSGVRLGILGALAILVMSFDSKNFPIEAFRPFLQQLPPVLAPAAGALKFATESQPDSIATVSLGLLALYAFLLLVAALWMASQRELILD